MSHLVCLQFTRLGERTTTLRTWVRFLPCVDSDVTAQGNRLGERLVACGASKGLLLCMNSHVLTQVHRLRGCIFTLETDMWFFSRVNKHVSLQGRWVRKDFPQREQGKGLTPQWIIWCFFRLCKWRKKDFRVILHDPQCLGSTNLLQLFNEMLKLKVSFITKKPTLYVRYMRKKHCERAKGYLEYTSSIGWVVLTKLDGVGPVDNRPSTD